MSKMKKMLNLIEKYDRLRKGEFKESMRKEMNELKELLHYEHYKLAKSVFETDQLDEFNKQ